MTTDKQSPMVRPHLGEAPEWMRRWMASLSPQASATCAWPSRGRATLAVAAFCHWSALSRVQRTAPAPATPSLAL
eukprot:4273014-Heterocapsa_arctica.AAC.1